MRAALRAAVVPVTIIHLKNVWGPSRSTLCGEYAQPDFTTVQPDDVTCEKCLALMGRAEPREPDAAHHG